MMKKILSILFLFISLFAEAQNQAGSSHVNTTFLQGNIKMEPSFASLDTNAQKLFALRLSDSVLVRVPWPTFGGGGGSLAIGSAVTSGTAGSVLFIGSTGQLQQKNSQFFYDSTNVRVGINTNSPLSKLYILNNSLGTTSNNNQGIWLANTTTGSQQISPPLVFEGNARFASVADSSFRYIFQAVPTGGSSVVTGNFLITPQVNGVNKNAVYINQNGQIGIGGMTPARELEARDSSGNPQLRLSVDGSTHLDMGVGLTGIISLSSTGSFANNITLGSGSGNVQVLGNHGASSYACYGAQNVGTNQYALVLGNLGTYGATRNAYIYDFVAAKGRTGWDVNGTMYVGSTNSVYTLSVAQPSAIAGTSIQNNISALGFTGIGVATPIGQLQVGGTVKYNSTGSYGTTGALIGTTPNVQLRDNFTTTGSPTQTHMAVNGFAVDSMGVQHSGITYTNASTVYIAGAPVSMVTTASDTAVTITNKWALYVNSGRTSLNGGLILTNIPSASGTVTVIAHQADSSISQLAVGWGIYLPTATAVLNVSSVTPDSVYWTRTGRNVHVKASLTVTRTSTGLTQINITLPAGLAANTSSPPVAGTGTSFPTGTISAVLTPVTVLNPSTTASITYFTSASAATDDLVVVEFDYVL